MAEKDLTVGSITQLAEGAGEQFDPLGGPVDLKGQPFNGDPTGALASSTVIVKPIGVATEAMQGEPFDGSTAIDPGDVIPLTGPQAQEEFLDRRLNPDRRQSIGRRPDDGIVENDMTPLRVVISVYPPKDKHPGYIGASYTVAPQDGESWRRGNDLSDGPADAVTLNRVLREIVKLVGDSCAAPFVYNMGTFMNELDKALTVDGVQPHDLPDILRRAIEASR